MHPLHAAHGELTHLVDIAERGERPATPAVLIAGVGLACVALVAIVITLAFSVGYLGARGSDRPVPVSASAQTVSLPREPRPLLQTKHEAFVETFWTIVSYAVLISLFIALPLALLALLWRAAGRQRTA